MRRGWLRERMDRGSGKKEMAHLNRVAGERFIIIWGRGVMFKEKEIKGWAGLKKTKEGRCSTPGEQ